MEHSDSNPNLKNDDTETISVEGFYMDEKPSPNGASEADETKVIRYDQYGESQHNKPLEKETWLHDPDPKLEGPVSPKGLLPEEFDDQTVTAISSIASSMENIKPDGKRNEVRTSLSN